MEEIKRYPIVVIGAGPGGLVVANGAAKAGKRVLLIEKKHYGGDCTNFGCIPSKTLISSAEVAHATQVGQEYGIAFESEKFTATEALDRIRKIIASVRSHEDPEALNKIGVDTLTGVASFADPHTLLVTEAGGMEHKIYGKNIVIATGSYPFIPPIEGLKDTPYLTNETIFDLKEIPKSLGILGAGPIGSELAQGFQRLGSEVVLIESQRGLMPNEAEETSKVMAEVFQKEKIGLHILCETNYIAYQNGKFVICIAEKNEKEDVEVDQLLIATGRRPNIADLQLEKAKVVHSEKGIPIDAYGRTNQTHIFAIGDVVGGPLFTHLAENHGRTVLTTLLLPGPFKKKLDRVQDVPRCTFTDPEIASFGLQEKEALAKYGEKKIATYTISFADIDRAICAARTEGFVKIVTKKWSSKILGATIVAPRAGEMLQELTLAKLYNIPLRKLRRLIHPYPVYSDAIRQLADQWLTKTILGSFRKEKKE